jgi:hypothetical protein
MQQTAEIPGDEADLQPVKEEQPAPATKPPGEAAPEAGELDIPDASATPSAEATKPNLSVLKGKVTKAQNALNNDPENADLKQALADAQAAQAAAS